VQVSQAYTILPNAAALSSISVSQTETLPTLVSGVDTGATKSVQVSQAYAGVPDTALAALSITVSTTETMPTLSASMYDIIGQISGGGTISDELPHRSITVATTETMPALSAAAGDGTLAPRLITVAQLESLPTLAAAGDAQRTISAAQIEEFPALNALVRGPFVEPPATATPGYTPAFTTRYKGKTLRGSTFQDLREKVAQLEEQAEKIAEKVKAPPVRIAKPAPVDPVIAQRDALNAQIAELQAQMVLMEAQFQASATQSRQQMQEEVQRVSIIAANALQLAQQAQQDNEALTALMLTE
jgi:hypothetical protein